MKNLIGWLLVKLFFMMAGVVLAIVSGLFSISVSDFLDSIPNRNGRLH